MKTSNPDPVHKHKGVWWFWNETWSDRVGSYVTKEGAKVGLEVYLKELNELKEKSDED